MNSKKNIELFHIVNNHVLYKLWNTNAVEMGDKRVENDCMITMEQLEEMYH